MRVVSVGSRAPCRKPMPELFRAQLSRTSMHRFAFRPGAQRSGYTGFCLGHLRTGLSKHLRARRTATQRDGFCAWTAKVIQILCVSALFPMARETALKALVGSLGGRHHESLRSINSRPSALCCFDARLLTCNPMGATLSLWSQRPRSNLYRTASAFFDRLKNVVNYERRE